MSVILLEFDNDAVSDLASLYVAKTLPWSEREEPLTSGRDNLKMMAVIDAIYSSAREGQKMTAAELLAH